MTTNSFLTVEDYNSIIENNLYQMDFHEIDTGLIWNESGFANVQYDFCYVNRTKNGNDITYQFNIENNIWFGGYYFLDSNGDYLDVEATWDDTNNILEVTTTEEKIRLFLHLSTMPNEPFNFRGLVWKLTSTPKFMVNQFVNDFTVEPKFYFEVLDEENFDGITAWVGARWEYVTIQSDSQGTYFEYTIPDYTDESAIAFNNGDFDYHYNFDYKRFEMLPITISTTTLYKSRNNQLTFTYPQWTSAFEDYQMWDCVIYYLDKKIDSVIYSKTCVTSANLDLTGYEKNSVDIKVHIPKFNYTYHFNLPCVVYEVDTVAKLTAECNTGGASIIRLTDDLQLSSTIPVKHSIKIIGDEHTIDLNQHSLTLNEGVETSIEKVDFYNGDTAITQKKNTKLTLETCSFTNCTSTTYNNLGSCIYCDVDIESLNNPTDFTTIIEDCTFTNNHSTIFHGGLLSVNKSKFLNNDLTYADKHNPSFLYQTDGNASITNNIFDINYTAETLCTNEESIGYAQALIQCGLTASINGTLGTNLTGDDKLQFDTNATHVFCKYYYPQIETCVYTSPMPNYEDKAVCYTVTGTNWIYKQNVQITRASWNTQNENTKINWE